MINYNQDTEKIINIKYFGELYRNNSQNVKIVYGFGDEWRNTTYEEMQKTGEGFVIQIRTRENDQLNYCFCNENNYWDNNFGHNYYFKENEENVYKSITDIFVTNFIEVPTENENYNQEIQGEQPLEITYTEQSLEPLEFIDIQPIDLICEETIENEGTTEIYYEPYTETKIKDNGILLISEVQNKVVLPYRAEEIKEILNNGKNEFNTPQEVIDEKFTRKFSEYSNQIVSRYREAVELITKREKMSKIDGINLGMELCKKRYLHPAIISACKNLDELNVYLDCLDKGELDDFKIFDIKYELYPVKASKLSTIINNLIKFFLPKNWNKNIKSKNIN